MRLETLTEYKTKTGVRLTRDKYSALCAVTSSISVSPTVDEEDCFDLTPGSIIGAINLGTPAIEIRPKLPIDRVLFLISYAVDPKNWRHTGFDFAEHHSLVEAIIPGFVAQIQRAFARGVVQGYRTKEDILMAVRGRIRFDDQMRTRFGIFPPVEVRYDEFTTDIAENQLIKAAIARLGRIQIRSPNVRKSLRAFDKLLESVELEEFDPRRRPEITYTRLNAHCRSAVELAKLILRSVSFELYNGRVSASCFLVDMNTVFEDFVINALRDVLRLSPREFRNAEKGRLHLDEASQIVLQPDISWWDGNVCDFVGDAKYKLVNVKGIKHPDLYQMLAYTVATNSDVGMLIYAAGEAEPVSHNVRWLGKQIEVTALDISGTPDDIIRQVNQLASRIRELRRKARLIRHRTMRTDVMQDMLRE